MHRINIIYYGRRAGPHRAHPYLVCVSHKWDCLFRIHLKIIILLWLKIYTNLLDFISFGGKINDLNFCVDPDYVFAIDFQWIRPSTYFSFTVLCYFVLKLKKCRFGLQKGVKIKIQKIRSILDPKVVEFHYIILSKKSIWMNLWEIIYFPLLF